MDATTVIGVGEGLKALEIGGKLAADVGEQAVKDGAEKVLEDGGEAAARDGTEQEEKNLAEQAAGGCNSFAYATLVATPKGEQAIGTLKVGDKVLAYDGPSGKVKSEPVQHVFVNHDTNLLDVTLAPAPTVHQGNHASTKQQGAALASHGSQAPPDEVLHTTTEHPFLTAELGWVNAQDLQPGEHVRRMDGSLGVVVGVTVVPGAAVRYNLTVANEHTYLVGQGQWVVHNCGGEGDTLYRVLREDEDASKGLDPRNPENEVSPLEHVEKGGHYNYPGDQFISTTTDPAALSRFGDPGATVAIIDRSKLASGAIIDLSTPEGLLANGFSEGSKGWNLALRAKEVLVSGSIPPEAIVGTYEL